MPILSASYTPEVGSVVNTNEEFFLDIKLENNEGDARLTYENCKIRVVSVNNSHIHPITDDSLPKTILANKSITNSDDLDEQFTLESEATVGNAVIEFDARYDLYFQGSLFVPDVEWPMGGGTLSTSIPITQG